MSNQGERGPKGDHGQAGDRGQTGTTGERGISFSKLQVLVIFLFVVAAFGVLAYRSQTNASHIQHLDREVTCLQNVKACELHGK